ncbi:MAG TPA: hypothetical protein VGZ90_18065 [Puia sp.]|jgi:hypothetical protein|nr:hypothetical protein [Puia sp.]
MKTLNIGVFLLLMALGCKKNNIVNTKSQDLFPNKIGNSWHYLVKDTTVRGNLDSGSVQYNVDVLIVDTVKLPNGITAAVWQFHYPYGIGSNFVFQTGDTVQFMDRTNSFMIRQYILPFSIGSSWKYTPGIASVSVIGQGSITVGNNSFADAWQIYGSAGFPDGIFTIDEWFADHVGFVRKYLNPDGELIYTKHILDWTLVSYELK